MGADSSVRREEVGERRKIWEGGVESGIIIREEEVVRVARLSREGDGRQLFSAEQGAQYGRSTDHCRIRHGE